MSSDSPRPGSSPPSGPTAPAGRRDRSAHGSDDEYSAGLWRLAGLGMTMTSEILGGALLGWVLDYLFGTKPVLLVVFTVLGVAVGMIGFIRSAIGASGDAGRDARSAVASGRAVALPPEPMDAGNEDAEGTHETDDPAPPGDAPR